MGAGHPMGLLCCEGVIAPEAVGLMDGGRAMRLLCPDRVDGGAGLYGVDALSWDEVKTASGSLS